MDRFVLFGPAHLGTLAMVALLAAGLVRQLRRHPKWAPWVRFGLASLLALLGMLAVVTERRLGAPWPELAPLHLCDAALLVGIWALCTLRPLATELLYFWGLSGTVLALLTPDLAQGFPHPRYLSYFALHGLVVVAAVVVALGLSRPPRSGAALRVYLWTQAYAAAVALANVVLHTNFLYLRQKPESPTPLDWLGPWPGYVFWGEVIAALLFWALEWPWRRRAVSAS